MADLESTISKITNLSKSLQDSALAKMDSILLSPLLSTWLKTLNVSPSHEAFTKIAYQLSIRCTAKKPESDEERDQLVLLSILKVLVPEQFGFKFNRFEFENAVRELWKETIGGTLAVMDGVVKRVVEEIEAKKPRKTPESAVTSSPRTTLET
ncbi:UNVERIFIED_CONTAM: hypothetical protein HDU68_007399 [Siphonaria sp. JEL0065]|nr:hypothetical protein HDU68_007399 [Siphonaria sp. JEL0065]